MSSNELLFTAHSPVDNIVTLFKDTYYGHIISSEEGHSPHDEFSPDDIKTSIEKPMVVYNGTRPDTHVYFAQCVQQFPKMYLKTVVDVYPNSGDVRTAHLAKDTKHGVKEVIYVDVNNKL